MGCAHSSISRRMVLDHQVAGLHQAASEHDHLRVEHADEVGDTHAEPARGFFEDVERGGVAAAGGFDHRLRVSAAPARRATAGPAASASKHPTCL